MRHPERACGTRIPGTSHIGKLLSGYIKTLWQRGEAEQKAGRPWAMDHLFSLVAYEVDRRHGDAVLPRRAVRAGIYACAVWYIGEAQGTPGLTPHSVAHAVGASLRTLQNIFAERQDAISRHIQNRRIITVARWLADPAMREQPIGQLAFTAGFSELSHFTHAFARAYKETPGAWRRRHLGK